MIGGHFYHNTIRKYTAIFGSLFNDISIVRLDKDGIPTQTIECPISFAPKEHFLMSLKQPDKRVSKTLPKLSYEMTGVRYDPTRKGNSLQRISTTSATVNSKSVQYNRVPYEIGYQLNIAVKHIDDGLQIIEQIAPFFAPHFTVAVKDNIDMNLTNDITIKLDDMDTTVEFEGDMSQQRAIIWTMNFTLSGFLYSPTADVAVIKEAILNINEDSITKLLNITHEVTPRTANEDDAHTITVTKTVYDNN